MSSKKARRKKAFLERVRLRAAKKAIEERRKRIFGSGSIEEAAAEMGVRLK